jgi:hypothetical protein
VPNCSIVASSSDTGEGYFDVVVASGRSVTTTSLDAGCGSGISCVVSFRLEHVITPRRLSLQK